MQGVDFVDMAECLAMDHKQVMSAYGRVKLKIKHLKFIMRNNLENLNELLIYFIAFLLW